MGVIDVEGGAKERHVDHCYDYGHNSSHFGGYVHEHNPSFRVQGQVSRIDG